MKRCNLIPLVSVWALVAGVVLSNVRAEQLPKPAEAPSVGSPAPEFAMTALDGRQVRLSEFRGKVLLIEFTATWCPACDKAASDTRALYKLFKESGFEAISISLDGGETTDTTIEDLLRFVRRTGIDWAVLFDNSGKDNLAAAAYGVESLPAHFLVDKSGIIRLIVRGRADSRQVKDQIRALLRQ